ncbi:unnamed protein product [Brassica oleracea var. botrytis]
MFNLQISKTMVVPTDLLNNSESCPMMSLSTMKSLIYQKTNRRSQKSPVPESDVSI